MPRKQLLICIYLPYFLIQFTPITKQSEEKAHSHDSPSADSETDNSMHFDLNNLTTSDVTSILRSRGFFVREVSPGNPLVFVGDIAYKPEQVIPELAKGRSTSLLIHKDRLWINEIGNAQAWYFYDSNSQADREVFQKSVNAWAESTCIIFSQMPDAPCSTKFDHGVVCVGDFGGCWSVLGRLFVKGEPPQKMSVQPKGCEDVAAAHEFGHALGHNHQQSRPDRDTYIKFNSESIRINNGRDEDRILSRWGQGGRCGKEQVLDISVPYDYMSLMHYRTSAFADEDMRPVFISLDGHYQYMLDYHRPAGMLLSFYDIYTSNVQYGCINAWTNGCLHNGKTPPHCKNLGYVDKNCVCRCPPGFSGFTCETKVDSLYPLLAKAKTMLEVSKTQFIYISDYNFLKDKGDGIADEFKYMQFFTVIVNGHEVNTQVSMDIHQSVQRSAIYMAHQDFLIRTLPLNDCRIGILGLWGISKDGKMRTECTSSLANNEEEGPMFRSKTNHMDFIYYSQIGDSWNDVDVTIDLMMLKLDVKLYPHPGKMLSTQMKGPPQEDIRDGSDGDTGTVNVTSSGNDTLLSSSKIIGADLKDGSKPQKSLLDNRMSIAALVIALVATLLGVVAITVICCRRKTRNEQTEPDIIAVVTKSDSDSSD